MVGRSFSSLEQLRRKPSRHHEQLFARLRLLVESQGSVEIEQISSAGRRFPGGDFRNYVHVSGLPSLDPWRIPMTRFLMARRFQKVDPCKIRLHGTGHWDATSYLSEELIMA